MLVRPETLDPTMYVTKINVLATRTGDKSRNLQNWENCKTSNFDWQKESKFHSRGISEHFKFEPVSLHFSSEFFAFLSAIYV